MQTNTGLRGITLQRDGYYRVEVRAEDGYADGRKATRRKRLEDAIAWQRGFVTPRRTPRVRELADIDTLRFDADAQRDVTLGADYQHHERDASRARRGEELVASILRAAEPEAVVSYAGDKGLVGGDIVVTLADGTPEVVEVKTGGLVLRESQFRRATELREHFILAVADPDSGEVEFIRDPVGTRRITPVTEYHVRGAK